MTEAAEGKAPSQFDGLIRDEAFWGDTLKLHQAIAGADLVEQIKAGKVNLDDPATTLALLKLNSVLVSQASLVETAASGPWGSSVHCATRQWTTHSLQESATDWMAGPTGILTSEPLWLWHPT